MFLNLPEKNKLKFQVGSRNKSLIERLSRKSSSQFTMICLAQNCIRFRIKDKKGNTTIH